jgi:hypothetical protein
MPTKKKRHLAIGGKIIGAPAPDPAEPVAEEPSEGADPVPETPPRPRKRRIAIGGRLY